jgi:excisionase family DNA binding protein
MNTNDKPRTALKPLPPQSKTERAFKTYLTIEEAAEVMRCSTITLRRAIKAKRLTCVKPNGKMSRTIIQLSDLEAYIRRGTHYAVGESAMTNS